MKRMGWSGTWAPSRGGTEPPWGQPVADIRARYGADVRLSAGRDPLAPGRPVLIVEGAGRAWLGGGELDEMIDALVRARQAFFGGEDA